MFSEKKIFFYALTYCMFSQKKKFFLRLEILHVFRRKRPFSDLAISVKKPVLDKKLFGDFKTYQKGQKNSKKKAGTNPKKKFFASKRPRTQVQYPVFENGLFPQCTPRK